MNIPCNATIANDLDVFGKISNDLQTQGFSINPLGIPRDIADALHFHLTHMPNEKFNHAGIGREQDFDKDDTIRGDEICWVLGDSIAGQQWLRWCDDLKQHLNRRLFLGLFSFESHFAHYPPQAFYQRHVDAFHGDKNRVLSVVLYLNKDWQAQDGGELVLYKNEQDVDGIKVIPELGTLVVFLSEEFPHEVLPATKNRLSIAGWYRVNGSHEHKVDPPN
ncbi:2OG-Fe(II) oxygenase [Thalassotalea sp. LPB0316]|uniref:2OG-Fe(II) oxygenase n=1 Tax=Thalassotalea sp. LPB0316 TaxID=2769490 RepID=UPI0018669832|nr:2OG-Fe(II) oxygenase [Thalassotalea sp. LPB0316]QOL26077.1 2OG-Fe(II) oxygenase [Thalassotalea sp. LPB0316]